MPETIVRLHLKTQRNQPYGSERRCCEECGAMLIGQHGEPEWTDEPSVYSAPPVGYVACRKVP